MAAVSVSDHTMVIVPTLVGVEVGGKVPVSQEKTLMSPVQVMPSISPTATYQIGVPSAR